uniref:Carbon monoxide dehydrogenase n=1 Tax=Candidatus Kentrum eta TaxID=2126337 RepID=A0A450UWE7_9GAMM|nr:MAG: Ni-dependent carbon monoxide dehydrogenase precursor [Candidatus Kentron sp. H]VFJ96864.1 MAG: Ni-dependent carbon monoxide dehydrogenase precursor [Candidatus Kentron sp. H]VFK02623.1 MAG: Ni-dependent carbon monoxide dehydrogenase precursor [Candidatus Kentron sp. H]
MNTPNRDPRNLSINLDTRAMLARASEENIETVWDRLAAQQPQCGYCSLGLSCRNCSMGPCRIDPFGEGPQKGVCGADADIIVARNLGRTIAAGASAHSDHGRDILEVFAETADGNTTGYEIRDTDKLKRLAAEYGVATDGRSVNDIARALADAMMADFGIRKGHIGFAGRAPEPRRALWERLGITPRGIDRENVEMLHRTHMGVDNDYANILLHGLRTSLSDGWGGSMVATELSDVLFGTPQPVMSQVNLGVLRKEAVNIALHGHNPLLSDVIVQAAADPDLVALAREKGASGINLVGLCCTGNELQMRRGIPMAGNHLMQELVIITGALDAMVVDYQCIMPAITDVARCFHTEVISTADKAKFPGATHISFDPRQGLGIGKEIVTRGIVAYGNRNPDRVRIPVEPVAMMAGFSIESILTALGGTPEPLVDAIKAGSIRGAVTVVGCNNPKIPQDYGHVTLTQRLIENDILVLVTGCAAVANGKAGHIVPEGADLAGPGLGAVCKALGIPPVLHMGSCVDNVRILTLAGALADYMGVDISALPLAGAAPEWYSEKAVSIGTYVVASGIDTVLGVQPPIFGSPNVVGLLASKLEDVVGAKFQVEPDPEKAALLIRRHIESKRGGLGLPFMKTSLS